MFTKKTPRLLKDYFCRNFNIRVLQHHRHSTYRPRCGGQWPESWGGGGLSSCCMFQIRTTTLCAKPCQYQDIHSDRKKYLPTYVFYMRVTLPCQDKTTSLPSFIALNNK